MATAFHDREREQGEVRRLIRSPHAELVIVYGRRGVGKSRLLEETIAGGRHVRYVATERVLPLQLDDMARALNEFAPGTVAGALRSADEFFDAVAKLARNAGRRPFVLVLDEFPYLARVDAGLLTAVQKWWNERKRAGAATLKVFLAGSNVSWMEREALSETAPLYSVRTANLHVDPLSYRDAARFYPRFAVTDRIRAWSVWGGMPAYLEQIEPRRSFWSNLERTTLVPSARLFLEPDWLKYTDLRADLLYSSIVRVIAQGERRPSKIATAVGRDSANEILSLLDRLRESGVIARVTPLTAAGEGPRQAARYVVADPFLAYWYRFIDPHRSVLEIGARSSLLRSMRTDADRGLDKYVSEQAFEEICRQFLLDALARGRLPRALRFSRVGAWWSTREREEQDEADVVAFADGRLVAIGECKWTASPADERDLDGLGKILREAADQLRPSASVYRMIFSRSGFAAALRHRAARPKERVLLFGPADLYA